MDIDGSIIGQNRAVDTLKSFYNSGRIPHAFLFSGIEGVGKHSTAIWFAKMLNSGEARSTKVIAGIEKLAEPFVKFIIPLPRGKSETPDDHPTAKLSGDEIENLQLQIQMKARNPYYKISLDRANNIKISSIRNIRKFLSLNYEDVKYRFIIISDAHLMSVESQNALLKSLEEPPEGIIFFVITSNKDKLLQTIQSRCWHVDFAPLQSKDVVAIVKQYYNYSDEQMIMRAAHFSDGSVLKTVNLIENGIDELLKTAITILRYSLGRRYNTAINTLQKVSADYSIDIYKIVIILILKWFDDILKEKLDTGEYYFEEYVDTLQKFNENFPKADIQKTVNSIERLISSVDVNIHLNVITANIIFEISYLSLRT